MLSGFPQQPTTNMDGNNNEIGAYIYGYRHHTFSVIQDVYLEMKSLLS
jgi:hypothetical protein